MNDTQRPRSFTALSPAQASMQCALRQRSLRLFGAGLAMLTVMPVLLVVAICPVSPSMKLVSGSLSAAFLLGSSHCIILVGFCESVALRVEHEAVVFTFTSEKKIQTAAKLTQAAFNASRHCTPEQKRAIEIALWDALHHLQMYDQNSQNDADSNLRRVQSGLEFLESCTQSKT